MIKVKHLEITMKKIAIILSLLSALLFSGCGGKSTLQFDNKWGENKIGYTEVLTYDVTYMDDYSFGGYDFTKNETLNMLKIEANGVYTVKNEILSLTAEGLDQSIKNNPVTTGMPYVIRTTSSLILSVSYDFNGQIESSNDVILTEAYYCPPESSLAPILSSEKYDYSLLNVTNSLSLTRTIGENTVTYDKENYVVNQKVFDSQTGEKQTEVEKTFSYESKTIIDNSALFLAIRNINYASTESIVPTVHATYGEAQDLKITSFDTSDITLNLTVNGENKEGVTIPTNAVRYLVSSNDKSGANQLVFLQNSDEGIVNKSLIIRYVSPISDYSAYRKAGSLIYTLKTLDFYS